jgi:hypothetical protein
MDLGIIELHLEPLITRAAGPGVVVRSGPPVVGPTTALRNEVFVHAAWFEDLGGVTSDGAQTARRPIRGSTAKNGYAEERPARIAIEVTCVSGSYRQMQQLCGAITPIVLAALEQLSTPVLASSKDRAVARFADASAVVHGCSTSRFTDDIAVSYRGRITFYINGFVHLAVTWGGREEPPQPTRPASKPRPVKKKKS